MLLVILIIFLCTIIFVEIGNMVDSGLTQRFDDWLLTSLRSSDNIQVTVGPLWLKEFMSNITALGSAAVIGIITILVAGFLIISKQYDALWFLLAATIGGAIIGLGLKDLYGRERPDLIFRLHEVNTLSFPSGHSMMSAVVYLTQAAIVARIQKDMKIRIYILSSALFLTFIIGISRIYLGVHYPTDIIGGWTVGLAWACFCWLILWTLQRRKVVKT